MKKNNKKAFTIVELVIVIAVVAILAAVLIPTFSSVVDNANDSAAEQEAKNAYTEYMIEAAGKGEVGTCYVYDAGDGRYVAIENGAVKGVYGSQADAVAAMIPGETYDANELKAATDKTGEKLYGYKLDTIISVPDQGGNNAGNGGNSEPPVHNTCGNGVEQRGQAATCTAAGWKDYYKCGSCDKLYSDKPCSTEITDFETWKTGDGKIDIDPNNHTQEISWTPTEGGHQQSYPCCNATEGAVEGHTMESGVCNVCGYGCEHTGGEATCTTRKICTTCGTEYGDLAPEHNYGPWNPSSNGTHTRVCTHNNAHTETVKCEGGTATCTAKAVCYTCNNPYGEFGSHTYGNLIAATDAVHTQTELKGAVAAHYQCSVCDKYFTQDKTEITLTELTGTSPSHSYVNGKCTCGKLDPNYLTDLGMKHRLDFNEYSNDGVKGNAINLQKYNTVSISPYAPNGSFSASFWIKITSAKSTDDSEKNGEGPIIFTNKDWTASGSGKGYVFYIQYKDKNEESEVIEFKFNSGNGTDRKDVQTTFDTDYLNEWIYVVCVVDLDDDKPHVRVSFHFREFITLKNSDDPSVLTDGYNSGYDLNIGHDSVQKDNYMFSDETLMDDFMYFDKALDNDDVAALKAYYRAQGVVIRD